MLLHAQERELRGAMHTLPTGAAEVEVWEALAAQVQQAGPSAVRRALGWQLYNVPNVCGAQGEGPSFPGEKGLAMGESCMQLGSPCFSLLLHLPPE